MATFFRSKVLKDVGKVKTPLDSVIAEPRTPKWAVSLDLSQFDVTS